VVFDGHILFTDRSGQLVRAQPVNVNVQQNGFKLDKLQINRAEIVLPSTLQVDQTITLNYRLSFTAEKLASAAENKIPTLIATPANGSVTLNWTPVPGATGYNIMMGTNAGNDGPVAEIGAHEHTNIVAAGVRRTSYVDNNLTNGWKYYYVVLPSFGGKIGEENSNEVLARPTVRPELKSAASRKTHGTVDYDVPIFDSPSDGGSASVSIATMPVECRSGSTLKLVATFKNPVSGGKARVAVGEARFNGAPTFAGNTMTVNLNDVSVRQKLQIVLESVKAIDGTELPTLELPIFWVMTGDLNGDLEVNAADTAQWQGASGTFAGSPGFDFRADITCNGAVNLADAIRIRENYDNNVP
jgi:hypothetical protein